MSLLAHCMQTFSMPPDFLGNCKPTRKARHRTPVKAVSSGALQGSQGLLSKKPPCRINSLLIDLTEDGDSGPGPGKAGQATNGSEKLQDVPCASSTCANGKGIESAAAASTCHDRAPAEHISCKKVSRRHVLYDPLDDVPISIKRALTPNVTWERIRLKQRLERRSLRRTLIELGLCLPSQKKGKKPLGSLRSRALRPFARCERRAKAKAKAKQKHGAERKRQREEERDIRLRGGHGEEIPASALELHGFRQLRAVPPFLRHQISRLFHKHGWSGAGDGPSRKAISCLLGLGRGSSRTLRPSTYLAWASAPSDHSSSGICAAAILSIYRLSGFRRCACLEFIVSRRRGAGRRLLEAGKRFLKSIKVYRLFSGADLSRPLAERAHIRWGFAPCPLSEWARAGLHFYQEENVLYMSLSL